MDTLYVPQIVKVKINLDPSELDANYEEKIRAKIKDKYGDTCYINGFIKRSSIEIGKIDNGRKIGSHLHGAFTFKVEFKALFCIPKKDKTIRCRIRTINKFGALATAYPMEIIIPRQIQQHQNIDIFATLKESDYVYVKTLDYTIKEDKLIVVGTIVELALDKPNSLDLPNDGLISDEYQVTIVTSVIPPTTNKLLGSIESLNQLKSKITPHVKLWESKVKYMISPYELIDVYRPDHKKKYNKSIIKYEGSDGLEPIFSRAYFKLWEILAELKLLSEYKGKPMRIANLAEGPGGFIHALIDYRNQQNASGDSLKGSDLLKGDWKHDNYYAITLKNTKELPVMDWDSDIVSKYFSKMNANGYDINLSYGKGSGNLLDINNIEHFTNVDIKEAKCQLVTADGGIELETDEEYSLQELANAKLFFAEILTALTIQAKDGIFILKIYDVYYDLTLQMILLLSMHYDQIIVIKPRTSRPANSEKYLVCTGFNSISKERLEELYKMFQKWLDLEPSASYLDNKQYVNTLFTMIENSGSGFMQNVSEFNDYNITMQIEKITEGLNLILSKDIDKKETIQAYKNSQKDLAIKWCEMFNVPYIKDLPLS